MSRLDDAGMHRADGNLVQVLALDRQEGVGRRRPRRRAAGAERMPDVPKAEIEPRPGVRRSDRFEPIEATNGALEPNGRRMQCADRRKCLLRTVEAQHRDLTRVVSHDRHVHREGHTGIAPQAEQRPAAFGEVPSRLAPRIRVDGKARPRPMIVGRFAFDVVDDSRHSANPIVANPTVLQRSGTRRRAPAACRCRRPARRRDE